MRVPAQAAQGTAARASAAQQQPTSTAGDQRPCWDCPAVQRLVNAHRSTDNITWDAHCGTVIDGYDFGETPAAPLHQPGLHACQSSCEAAGKLCEAFTFVLGRDDGAAWGAPAGHNCFLKTLADPKLWRLLRAYGTPSADAAPPPPLQAAPAAAVAAPQGNASGGGCVALVTVIKRPRTCTAAVRSSCRQVEEDLTAGGLHSSANWKVFCNVDIQDSDLRELGNATIQQCASECRDFAPREQCKAFTYVYGRVGTADKNCFLKSTWDVARFKLRDDVEWSEQLKEVRCVATVTVLRTDPPRSACMQDTPCLTAFVLSILAGVKALFDLVVASGVAAATLGLLASWCGVMREEEGRLPGPPGGVKV